MADQKKHRQTNSLEDEIMQLAHSYSKPENVRVLLGKFDAANGITKHSRAYIYKTIVAEVNASGGQKRSVEQIHR